ncbi:MAG: PEP-CTERM sorting domain-containing protein [bacterium]|nr:PEP-CTERM sorting domain-containing protein [bacterium]
MTDLTDWRIVSGVHWKAMADSSPRHRLSRICIAITAIASLTLPAAPSFATPITTPTDLLPGAQYRLAFVTVGTRNAVSADIADYDAFVTAEANSVPELSSLGTTWQVIGSTATVDARDHTGTDPLIPDIPIYRLDDIRLVDDYADLWDASLDAPLRVDSNGNIAPVGVGVYTGTIFSGVAVFPLGGAKVTLGAAFDPGISWIQAAYTEHPSVDLESLYALSAILTVPVPEAGATVMLTLACVALLLDRRD